MGVAVPVNRLRGDSSGPHEALHRGDDQVDPLHRASESGRVANVGVHQLHIGVDRAGMGCQAATEDSDRKSTVLQPVGDDAAETPGAACDEDHGWQDERLA